MESGEREERAAACGGAPVGERLEQKKKKRRQVIRWERFLPRRSLRVMLVEQDDSTRHIVTALLRKCSYHVAAVADGPKAWEVLQEKDYNFDLVLSEVEIPSLSGISLLSKIMGNDLSKNIPVIMMSSHDSVNVVFKCMLEGAVDFLVKPLRRNELRNLWQHVWRRHCSTSYKSGLENTNNNQKKTEEMSDNNAASNHISGNAGNGSETGVSCDKGSDNRGLGSKLVMEIESSRKCEELLVEDGSFSRAMKAKPEQPSNGLATSANISETQYGGETKKKIVGIEVTVMLSIQDTPMSEKRKGQVQFSDGTLFREKNLGFPRSKDADADPGSFCQNAMPNESSRQIIGFVGPEANDKCSYAALRNDNEREDVVCEATKFSNLKNTCSTGSSSSWELSLKRSQLDSHVKQGFQEMHILNHSASSAFSRYCHTGMSVSPKKSGSSPATLCIGTREHDGKSQVDYSHHGTGKEELAPFSPSGRLASTLGSEGEAIAYRQVSSVGNNEDGYPFALGPPREGGLVGHSSTEDNMSFPHPPVNLMSLPVPVGSIPIQGFCAGYGPFLQPIFYPELSVKQHVPGHVKQSEDTRHFDQPGSHGKHIICDNQTMPFYHCEERHRSSQFELGTRKKSVDAESGDPRITCSDMDQTDQITSCIREIFNVSGNNGVGETANAAVNVRTTMESGHDCGFQNHNGKVLDCDRSVREAALIKFRMKRKDRCFEKKVRYHSRKMLAEQRPRVKGQFVRQAAAQSTPATTETDE